MCLVAHLYTDHRHATLAYNHRLFVMTTNLRFYHNLSGTGLLKQAMSHVTVTLIANLTFL